MVFPVYLSPSELPEQRYRSLAYSVNPNPNKHKLHYHHLLFFFMEPEITLTNNPIAWKEQSFTTGAWGSFKSKKKTQIEVYSFEVVLEVRVRRIEIVVHLRLVFSERVLLVVVTGHVVVVVVYDIFEVVVVELLH